VLPVLKVEEVAVMVAVVAATEVVTTATAVNSAGSQF
jgi:hypothetical protein